MSCRILLLLPLLLLAAVAGLEECKPLPPPAYCSGTVPPPIEEWDSGQHIVSQQQTLVGGERATNRYSTALLSGCTGVVLSPHTVLTAAHCGSNWDGYNIKNLDDKGTLYPIVGRLEHPDYREWNSNGDLEARRSDLQLLYTDKAMPGPYAEIFYDTFKFGNTCRRLIFQGYGKEAEGIWWNLNQADAWVRENKGKTLSIDIINPGGFCYGDSGGPTYAEFDNGYVMLVGIHSTLNKTNCMGEGHDIHVNYFEDWIKSNTRP